MRLTHLLATLMVVAFLACGTACQKKQETAPAPEGIQQETAPAPEAAPAPEEAPPAEGQPQGQ